MKRLQRYLLRMIFIGAASFLLLIPYTANADPNPEIKINGSDGPVQVKTNESVSITVEMTAGTAAGNTADWWVVQQNQSNDLISFGPQGTWLPGLVSVFQGPLFNLPSVSLLNASLPEGTHTFYFGVDQTPDGSLNFPLDFDAATVTVKPRPSGSAVSGDYGDAPDGASTGYPDIFSQTGNFPTLFSNNGARTLSVDDGLLGTTASVETDASDPADPDGPANLGPVNTDSDDAITNFFLLLTSIPPPATLTVLVNGPKAGSGGDFFLNVLIDLDMDGSWGGTAGGGEPEWVVKNYPVVITPGAQTTITPPAFAFANGLILPDGAWMRIALTKESITDADWNGAGEFSAGEIEDHIISLPELNGKKHPILTVDCYGPYTFGGAGAIPVNCDVTNWRRDAGGTFDWTVSYVSGAGVDVNPKAGGPVGAPDPGNAVNVGLTATRIAGNLPSTWKFTATPDPEAIISDEGVILGHGESAITFDFIESSSSEVFYVESLEAGFVHFSGFSEISSFIQINSDDPNLLTGSAVTVALLLDENLVESKTVDVDPSGSANVVFKIFQYGNYTVKVQDILGSGTYDSSQDAINTVDILVN